MSEDENNRFEASGKNAMTKILRAYDEIFSYYDSVNLLTVEDTEHKEFEGSGVNAIERDDALYDDSERNPPGLKPCTHFFDISGASK